MKSKKSAGDDPQGSLFQVELVKIIDISHPLAELAETINRSAFEDALGGHFREDNGAPGKPVRRMAGPHHLKRTFNLSDESTVERWTENPSRQYFFGRLFGGSFPSFSPLFARAKGDIHRSDKHPAGLTTVFQRRLPYRKSSRPDHE